MEFSSLEKILENFFVIAQGIIVIFSVVFMVLGGIFYATSNGNKKRIEKAKNFFVVSIIGLSIGIVAPLFLTEIAVKIGWSGVDMDKGPAMEEIFLNVSSYLVSLVGMFSIIMLIVMGIIYIISIRDEEKIRTKKGKALKYSIIGVAVSYVLLIIIRQIEILIIR